MRNLVLIRADLEEGGKPLSAAPLVATFTLAAAHTNTMDVVLTDGKGTEIPIPPGGQYRFERVNLAEILVRSKAGEAVFVVGHTA